MGGIDVFVWRIRTFSATKWAYFKKQNWTKHIETETNTVGLGSLSESFLVFNTTKNKVECWWIIGGLRMSLFFVFATDLIQAWLFHQPGYP